MPENEDAPCIKVTKPSLEEKIEPITAKEDDLKEPKVENIKAITPPKKPEKNEERKFGKGWAYLRALSKVSWSMAF